MDGNKELNIDYVQYVDVDRKIAQKLAPVETSFKPIYLGKLFDDQLQEVLCYNIRRRLHQMKRLSFEIDDKGILVRYGKHGCQIMMPHSMSEHIRHINNFAKLSDHPDLRILYCLIRRNLYSHTLAVHFDATIRRCSHCVCNRRKLRRNVAELQLLPVSAPLESVCTDIMGEI